MTNTLINPYITPFAGVHPQIDPAAWVDVSARLIGRVSLAARVTVWPGAVLRADDEDISVGEGSAVLDLCLLEAPTGKPVRIGPGALISHQATVHGATVEAGALVGIGAIVLDGAVVGAGGLIGAGALVPPGMRTPPNWLLLGQPAKPVRELTSDDHALVASQLADLRAKSLHYQPGAPGGAGRVG
jgi:carbonic anhydrase/acetyltransferase-like protein (isoleucine patch superfamily)